MAKTLSDLRLRLDELGRQFDPDCPKQRDEILTLAFLLYDPAGRDCAEYLADWGVESVDSSREAFWNSCVREMKLPGNWRQHRELIHDGWLKTVDELPHFDPQKGSLTAFFAWRVKQRAKDQYEKVTGWKKTKDGEGFSRLVSLDVPVGAAEEAPSLGETFSWEERGYRQVEEDGFDVARVCELLAAALMFSEDRDRVGVREQKRRQAFRVIYTSGMIDLEHDGQEEPDFRFRSRIEQVLLGAFSDHCLEKEPGVSLPAIRRSPIRGEHYLPLGGYSDERRMVGRLKDAAAAGFLGLAKSSFSETRKKYRAFLWDELRKKHMSDEYTERT